MARRFRWPDELPQQTWTVLDFDAHWPQFWQAWTTDEVQYSLEEDMAFWCEDHAYPQGGVQPTWNPGDPLWHLSRTDHWDEIISEKVEKRMDELFPDPYGCYKRTMQASFLPVLDPDTFFETVIGTEWHAMSEKLYAEYKPQPGTLESLVLVTGANYLAFALAVTACVMFPDKRVTVVRNCQGDMFAVLRDDGIIMDLIGHYNTTRLGFRKRRYGAMIFEVLVTMRYPVDFT